MNRMLSIALLVSIIVLVFSQFASVHTKQPIPESSCSAYGVTPCLIPGATREDANYLPESGPNNNFEPPKEPFSASEGLTPELRGGITREGPRPTPELVSG